MHRRDEALSRWYHTRIPARGEQLTGPRRALGCWARQHGFHGDTVQQIELACYEAMANVVEHAYSDGGGDVQLSATAHPDRLDVVVSDDGRWRPPRGDPDDSMGITLIHRLSDHANINTGEDGTVVSMTWFRNHGRSR